MLKKIIPILSMALVGCGDGPTEPPPVARGEPTFFADGTAAAGLDFVHDPGVTESRYMPEIMGSGVALLDFDNDGDLDAYFVQGGRVDGKGDPISDRLYRNDLADGQPVFVDVTDSSGLSANGYGMGVATGDFDADGWVDLYVTNFGQNQLLRNRGDGTFEDVTDTAGVGDDRWSVPASFLDYDNDGDHDLFVGSYVDFRVSNHKDCVAATGLLDYCSPHTYSALADRLFENKGDGTFTDVTSDSGIRSVRSKALGVSVTDFDGDGTIDIYVANDGVANQLWLNQGDGTFKDNALMSGSALNFEGSPEASMGVDAADIDGDGDEDLFITHLRSETNTLYINRGNAEFEDSTIRTGLAGPSIPLTGFGTAWFDLGNDGDLDLFTANGAVTIEEKRIAAGDDYPFDQRNQLFLNQSGEKFIRFNEVVWSNDAALAAEAVSRGAAFGDINNDGRVDILVSNNNGSPQLLLNNSPTFAKWLGLDLRLGDSQSIALGAAVTIVDGVKNPTRRVRTSGSYASASDARIVFGLGQHEAENFDVVVVWPDGETEQFSSLGVKRYHTLVQGNGDAS
ncbi:MAG: CRTAC1 family protein [Pseudomonadota bacterium]